MPTTYPVYRDIYIDKGTRFAQVIELSGPFADYDFEGQIKSSYSSLYAIPIEFAAVEFEPNKCEIFVTAENTANLRRLRGIYDIFATNKDSLIVHKEREGIAHYNNSASLLPVTLPPPPGWQSQLSDIVDAGTAAAANVEDFATAAQGELADTAVQPGALGTAAAANVEDFATAAQGELADTAVQPGTLGTAAAANVEDFAAPAVTRTTAQGDPNAAVAVGTITFDTIEVGDTVTIGSAVYAFRSAVFYSPDYEIKLGATLEESISNLALGINSGGYSSLVSFGTEAHPDVTCEIVGSSLVVSAKVAGPSGSEIVTTSDLTSSGWAAGTLQWDAPTEIGQWWRVGDAAPFEWYQTDTMTSWKLRFVGDAPYFTKADMDAAAAGTVALTSDIPTGTAASANVEDFATSAQGLLADTALQPEDVRHEFTGSIDYLGRAPTGSLDADPVWAVTRLTIATDGSVTTDVALTLIAWDDRADSLNY